MMLSARGKSILYITYDGLTDPIGQAQVLPYLLGCARAGHRISVVSFEKAERFALEGPALAKSLEAAGIDWSPQRFRTWPPMLSKRLDQRDMLRAAARLAKSRRFDLVHCRSYPSAVAGLQIKRRHNIPLLFDMRGFWVDQRREGGRWREDRWLGRYLYRTWKGHEAELVREADHIITLTKAAKDEVKRWTSYSGAPVSVIPCCADFELFRPMGEEARSEARRRADLQPDAPVLVYLGSLGTVYRLGEQLCLFAAIRVANPGARLLFIGPTPLSSIRSEAARVGVELAEDEIRTVRSARAEIPFWLAAGDAGLCFITPTFSSLGVSATKIGEYLACGLPFFSNHGVGDIEAIAERTGGGHVVPNFSQESLERAAEAFGWMRSADREAIRAAARPYLDLRKAISAYSGIYDAADQPLELVF